MGMGVYERPGYLPSVPYPGCGHSVSRSECGARVSRLLAARPSACGAGGFVAPSHSCARLRVLQPF